MRKNTSKKVISASRRIELLGYFPDRLMDFLQARCPPEKVHTIVLWSKKPVGLIHNQTLRKFLTQYDQLFLHFTITGMGGSFLEPGTPRVEESFRLLPSLIDILGDPRRIVIRFDPIVHFRLPDGKTYTNLSHFEEVLHATKSAGISRMIISWAALYSKVMARLGRLGIEPILPSTLEWQREVDYIFEKSHAQGIEISACCVPGLPRSSCIDGALLSLLHPRHLPASTQKAKGQRVLCGCTESWDIGWYFHCPGGCGYCYANPQESPRLIGPSPL